MEKVTHCPGTNDETHTFIVEFKNTLEHDSFMVGPFFKEKETALIYEKAPDMYEALKLARQIIHRQMGKGLVLSTDDYATMFDPLDEIES